MAKIKKNDLKRMGKDDLKNHLVELKKQLMGLKAKASTGTALESPGMIKAVKKNIARVITLMNQKKEETKTK